MKKLNIKSLYSGGVITNYYCSSRCGHCLYACSPKWEKKYMDEETASNIFKKIKSMGCSSVHIGGGEPFLNPTGLEKILKRASAEKINIEYIETNSSWFNSSGKSIDILSKIISLGVKTLLISISPFHNEFVPFNKVKSLMKACSEIGVNVFPWVQDFYFDIDSFDGSSIHEIKEFEEKFGDNYTASIPSRYWIHYGGRALSTFKDILRKKNLNDVINCEGCSEISDTSHFHFDLFGNYVPGLCSGLAIDLKDMGDPLVSEKYPLITLLYSEGIEALLNMAQNSFGFTPHDFYLNKCHLCLDIRCFLVKINANFSELQPREFYFNL